ncbi:endonuclease/exonuclease/phosphatase family protein [Phreatobacter sp.]|uniref:endonuclease/exonuclease/phosphatase family protein n=1 Tax=Phreatobacter sp. TaxID=1966341 RepID=UPI0022C83FBB|nr:endonuclease/exonuclease/phosphatase family protein [Phreatobacter sp.]MCZ8316372.1 endonuclease/exonuclease/phosphatase family protein [Phreatobacter sp.]
MSRILRQHRSADMIGAVGLAVLAILAATGPGLADFRIATWNIQTLASPGRKVFPNQDYVRNPTDLAMLAEVGRGLRSDVIALQEIASPAALAAVFPVRDWTLCISGQFYQTYPQLGRPPVARCVSEGPLDDTPAAVPLAGQFTAFAVRKEAGIAVEAGDVPELGVTHRDDDGVERPVRWGLVARLSRGGETLTLLNVHLKSGCFDDPPSADSRSPHCVTFARQIPLLDGWSRAQTGPFVILGDFNRRLDLDRDEVLARLTGADTPAPGDDRRLIRFPFRRPSACLPQPIESHSYVSIDYILLGPGLRGRDYAEFSPPVPDDESPRDFKKRFGDHCPKVVRVGP